MHETAIKEQLFLIYVVLLFRFCLIDLTNNKQMKKIVFLLCTLFLITACQYEVIEVEPIIPPSPDDQVDEISFANEIIPIFTTNNKCTACHTIGKTAPDLSAGNAFQSITSGNFVVSNNPEASKIYTYTNPSATTHVWKHYSSKEADLVYYWINQGAKDN